MTVSNYYHKHINVVRLLLEIHLFICICGVCQISFLDYMCYIPLFMSMHDNIVHNPLDMSNQKYQAPPRQRPASVQRDMNPLGNNGHLSFQHLNSGMFLCVVLNGPFRNCKS